MDTDFVSAEEDQHTDGDHMDDSEPASPVNKNDSDSSVGVKRPREDDDSESMQGKDNNEQHGAPIPSAGSQQSAPFIPRPVSSNTGTGFSNASSNMDALYIHDLQWVRHHVSLYYRLVS